jgi:hypothetical protein
MLESDNREVVTALREIAECKVKPATEDSSVPAI